ncbi:hypothetical protein BBD39_11065 [Arsenophonus endosymbiont of Bemisia tabaci Asia II 3]|nr:hypothetical protein BBD39_11065 [Arsenophonus endosymbiont of Bemisia tabaci Asia II 3]
MVGGEGKVITDSQKAFKSVFREYWDHADYRTIIQLGAFRYDKDGQIAGEVTQADVEDILQRLARRKKSNP